MVRIEWSIEAENDLDAIMAYISNSSIQYARTLFENIHEIIENLNSFPKMGRKVPESDNPEDRELIVQNYRIIYQFIEEREVVFIKMIIHGSRLLRI